jgi:hypothetical protein
MDLKKLNGSLWYLLEEKKIDKDFHALEADRIGLFTAFYHSFLTAKESVGQKKRFYDIGGYIICLNFAGEGLISKIHPALAHLEVKLVENPDFTICLWDTVSTNTPPSLFMSLYIQIMKSYWCEYLGTRKEIKEFNSDRIYGGFHIGPNILSMFDKKKNIGIYWVEDAQEIPYYEHGSPLQTILNWWTTTRDRQYVHAGAVGLPHGGVLIAGKGGSGKSTSCLACLDSDLNYASDDYCLISCHPQPYVYSLYNTVKLVGMEDFKRFPHLTTMIANQQTLAHEKVMIFLHQHYQNKIVKGFPIKAILAPTITGKKNTRIIATSPMNALKALAPSTLFQLSRIGKQALQTMSALTQEVDCYTLELGTDISQVPNVILELLG